MTTMKKDNRIEAECVKQIQVGPDWTTLNHGVYTHERVSELAAEKYVKKNFDKYYRQYFADKILSGEIPIQYYCVDNDGGYFVDPDEIVDIDEFENIKDSRDEF